jgi:hypothetical protein
MSAGDATRIGTGLAFVVMPLVFGLFDFQRD